ncbi:hypothetical protein H8F21_15820 [Pseudomonas sp. P66]|uniref:Uncharacterized protein n=1 Tax=Pseudomonas arcuscaelestis TaxID=2710591 RepID=A0ABS2C1C9_9PSED|nr:hypothetical protein [Pseudomonas arcuscaelestis]MBM5459036.1 hypothetical protein [Pseudomonas arcuscaelestis]
MKQCALALAVIGALGFVPNALAHELAFSKKDQIMVEVPGTATTWCKPDIELTITRPTWDNQQMLTGLVSVLPFVLGKDCPAAKVTWNAVDAAGKLYASGSGHAANLGIVTLAEPPAPAPAPAATPPVTAVADPTQTSSPVEKPTAETPATAPAVTEQTAPAEVPEVAAPAQTVATPAETSVSAPVPAVAAESLPVSAPAPAPAAPAAVVAAPTSDFGRSLVISNPLLTQITDGAGCKWVVSKSLLERGADSLSFSATPAMPCQSSGFSEGGFDKLSWKIQNTYRSDTWGKVYVHPSGLMFSKSLEEAVKGKAVSFFSPDAAQALFLLGELPERQMKVYLAYQRATYQVLGPFKGAPYYVVTTSDESFALDPVQYKQAALEVFQLIKTTSPTTVGLANFFVSHNLDALYPVSGWGDDQKTIIRNRMGEERGQFHFDALNGRNWALGREKERVQEERRQMERMASLHSRVLARYEQLKTSLKDYEGHESEALAQLAGIRARFTTPLSMMDPSSSMRASPMMVHVTGKDGEFYEIDFPAKGRLQSDHELGKEWYILPAANMTPVAPLVNGKAIPTFKVYSAGEPEACKQASCADRVSFGAVLGREFPDAGIDSSWTPEVSQQRLNTWNNASAQIQ